MDSTQEARLREIESAVRLAEPVALDFYQASCPPCRVLEPRLKRVAQEYAGRVAVYCIDVDRNLPVAERFEVIVSLLCLSGRRAKKSGALTASSRRPIFVQLSIGRPAPDREGCRRGT
jgi:thiol-disulfide isomerase/thioredoxin